MSYQQQIVGGGYFLLARPVHNMRQCTMSCRLPSLLSEKCFQESKWSKIRWRPGFYPGSRRRSLQRSPRPPSWGFSSLYDYTVWRRTNKFGVVTHMGEGLVLDGKPCPSSQLPRRRDPNFAVLRNLCVHSLT